MISQKEYEKLKSLDDDRKWIARDLGGNRVGNLFAYSEKPFKHDVGVWDYGGGVHHIDNRLFQFIQWEDGEPRSIPELIREYESEEDPAKTIKLNPQHLVGSKVEFYDPVHKPGHYVGDKGMEMREVQENFAPRYAKYGGLAVSDVKDIFKYIGRAPLKNGVQDLHKAKKHLEWLIKRVEGDGSCK